jgi:hypothetical protein
VLFNKLTQHTSVGSYRSWTLAAITLSMALVAELYIRFFDYCIHTEICCVQNMLWRADRLCILFSCKSHANVLRVQLKRFLNQLLNKFYVFTCARFNCVLRKSKNKLHDEVSVRVNDRAQMQLNLYIGSKIAILWSKSSRYWCCRTVGEYF